MPGIVKAHLVTCVRTLPRTFANTAPTGAPAEKVANAMERDGPGGNDFARIPSWPGTTKNQRVNGDDKKNTYGGWDYSCRAYAL